MSNKYLYPIVGIVVAGLVLYLATKKKGNGDGDDEVVPTPEKMLRENDSGRVMNAKQKVSAMKYGLNVSQPTTIKVLKSDGTLGNIYNVDRGKLYSKENVKGVRKDGYIIVHDKEVGGNFFGFGSFESDAVINPYHVIAI